MTREQTRVLNFLKERQGSWCNARDLVISTEACAYCRVISELRTLGYQIENKVERDGRKTINGFYMLLTERQQVAHALANGKKVARERLEAALKDDDQPMLFADMKKGPHRDDG
jgi:hypothetical protein